MGLDRDLFLDEVDEDLLCTICGGVMDKPTACGCRFGHVFCRHCIETWAKINPLNPTCPGDREPITVDGFAFCHAVYDKVKDLKLRCPRHASHSCEWEGPVSDDHDAVCPFMDVPCPRSSVCGKILRKDLQEHYQSGACTMNILKSEVESLRVSLGRTVEQLEKEVATAHTHLSSVRLQLTNLRQVNRRLRHKHKYEEKAIVVDARGGPHGLATIQEAIAKAQAGDTILVYPGLYIGPLVITKKVHLRGTKTPDEAPSRNKKAGRDKREPSGGMQSAGSPSSGSDDDSDDDAGDVRPSTSNLSGKKEKLPRRAVIQAAGPVVVRCKCDGVRISKLYIRSMAATSTTTTTASTTTAPAPTAPADAPQPFQPAPTAPAGPAQLDIAPGMFAVGPLGAAAVAAAGPAAALPPQVRGPDHAPAQGAAPTGPEDEAAAPGDGSSDDASLVLGCVVCLEGDHVELDRCRLECGNAVSAVRVTGVNRPTRATLTNCAIVGGQEYGVRVEGRAHALITECSIKQSGQFGVLVVDSGSWCVVAASHIKHVFGSGINVVRGAHCVVDGCHVSHSHGAGIFVSDPGTRSDVTETHVRDVKCSGVVARDQCSVTVTNSLIGHCGYSGVEVLDTGTRAILRGNQVGRPKQLGVWVSSGAHATMEQNHIIRCGMSGLLAEGDTTEVLATANRVESCGGFGIWLKDKSRGALVSNTMRGCLAGPLYVDPSCTSISIVPAPTGANNANQAATGAGHQPAGMGNANMNVQPAAHAPNPNNHPGINLNLLGPGAMGPPIAAPVHAPQPAEVAAGPRPTAPQGGNDQQPQRNNLPAFFRWFS